MTTLLQLKTSIFAEDGQSSRLTDEFVRNWRAAIPRGRVIVRDLAALPVPHLTAERFLAFSSKEEDRAPEQQAVLDYSDALIDELKQADEIVLATPLYNFGLPSDSRRISIMSHAPESLFATRPTVPWDCF